MNAPTYKHTYITPCSHTHQHTHPTLSTHTQVAESLLLSHGLTDACIGLFTDVGRWEDAVRCVYGLVCRLVCMAWCVCAVCMGWLLCMCMGWCACMCMGCQFIVHHLFALCTCLFPYHYHFPISFISPFHFYHRSHHPPLLISTTKTKIPTPITKISDTKRPTPLPIGWQRKPGPPISPPCAPSYTSGCSPLVKRHVQLNSKHQLGINQLQLVCI